MARHIFATLLLTFIAVPSANLNGQGGPIGGERSSTTGNAVDVSGKWFYRSFRSVPQLLNPQDPIGQILFGQGELVLTVDAAGAVSGTLGGTGWQLRLTGTRDVGKVERLQFRGQGTIGGEEWIYDYLGYVVPNWPNGIDQRPAIVGSIIRVVPHSSGSAPAGFVAQWIAVRADTVAEDRDPNGVASHAGDERFSTSNEATQSASETAEDAAADLVKAKWRQFFLRREKAARRAAFPQAFSLRPEVELPLPQSRTFALSSREQFVVPPAATGLNVTLNVEMAQNRIGADPVFLRSYNGALVGPTMRVKRGQTLRVTLDNRLSPDTFGTGQHNSLHDFNTTNLHSHGLHVSPAGNSDNVVEPVRAGQSRVYEYVIGSDHPSGTFWYHAHWHGSVAAQVGSGMAGALIVDGDPQDAIDDLEDVPEIAAARERVFVLQQIPYYNENLPEGVIEAELAGELFGPGDWDRLQRFTTINGIRLPVIEAQPGSVERWRLIDSGFREQIKFKIEPVNSGAPPVRIHEIALDGLATGRLREVPVADLYPGYRADVLVQMPTQPGEYLLVDDRNMENPLVDTEPRKYLGRLVVKGEPNPMQLPLPESLAATRMPSLTSATPGPNIVYEINLNPLRFQINGESFSENNVRPLTLGRTEEWTVMAGGQALTAHPFHIHVNPFELISVVGATGQEHIDEMFGGPVWKDTVLLQPGYRFRFRTNYKAFTGKFVQHCHIFEHEDMGMMEYVEIIPAGPADPLSSRSPETQRRAGEPSVMLFIRGAHCPHCVEQVKRYARIASERGIELVVVSGSREEDDRSLAPLRITLIADPSLDLFRQYGAYDDGLLHATLAFGPRGTELFRHVGGPPFMDSERVFSVFGRAMNSLTQQARLRHSIDDPQFDLAGYLHAFDALRRKPANQLWSFETFRRLHNGGRLPNGKQGGCIHGEENFLPWHRMLLAQFEKALQDSDPPETSDVMLPYWDFSKPPTGHRFPVGFENQSTLLWHANRFNLLQDTDPFWVQASRQLEADRSTIMDPARLNSVLFNLPRYRRFGTNLGFSDALESVPHNWMHIPYSARSPDEDMGDDITAAVDPIFWSFHCYLDLMWYRWQILHGAFEGSAPELLPSDLTVEYDHFPIPIKVGDVLDPKKLGYTYQLENMPAPEQEFAGVSQKLRPLETGSPRFSWPKQVAAADLRAPLQAMTILSGLKSGTEGSWIIEYFLHPAEIAVRFDDPDFRDKYLAGLYVEWRGSHRPVRDGFEDILVPLSPGNVAASQADNRAYIVSLNFVALPLGAVDLAPDGDSARFEAPKAWDYRSFSVRFE